MRNEKQNARASAHSRRILMRVVAGFQAIKKWRYNYWILICYLIFVLVTWLLRYRIEAVDWDTPDIVYFAISTKWVIIYILLFSVICFIASRPLTAYFIENSLIEAGVVDHIGLPPQFLFQRKTESSDEICFYSKGIPIEEWRDRKEELESSLNLHILDMVQGRNNREVVLTASSGNNQMADYITWKRSCMPKSPYLVACGESYGTRIDISLRETPHILLAGSTGSGKSWLLKLLLVQLIQKESVITIADFKGGIDFGPYWDANATILTDLDDTIAYLHQLSTLDLKERKELLKASGCSNIDEYNTQHDDIIPRLVFACDEVAELMDKTGVSKERKEKISEIEGYLSTIARLGRAVGIHLILAMQRPDANVLPGQIKNNIDGRLCGKCEDTLSMIVLDNTDASRKIPKSSHGVFVNQDGIIFKAYALPPEYK